MSSSVRQVWRGQLPTGSKTRQILNAIRNLVDSMPNRSKGNLASVAEEIEEYEPRVDPAENRFSYFSGAKVSSSYCHGGLIEPHRGLRRRHDGAGERFGNEGRRGRAAPRLRGAVGLKSLPTCSTRTSGQPSMQVFRLSQWMAIRDHSDTPGCGILGFDLAHYWSLAPFAEMGSELDKSSRSGSLARNVALGSL